MSDPDAAAPDERNERIYEETAARVGEGLAVDWDRLEAEHPELRSRLRALRRVQEIDSAFRGAGDEIAGDDPSSVSAASAGRGDSARTTTAWGPFELIERIGEGSFAEVYRALDPVLDREVALKLARGESAAQRRRFLQEGRLLAQLDHPGVVRVHGAAVHDDRAGVWMDLAGGRTLEQRLEQDGLFTERETIDVGLQLSAALMAVHSSGLVHGDVKAANVLRRESGALLLGDFGSSLELRAADRQTSATPLTAAPEVLEGAQPDARSDLFSLGVLLYRLLTGVYPFAGDSLEQIRERQRAGAPALRRLRPEASSAVADLVQRALQEDPSRRWADAESLHRALEGLAEGGAAPASRGLAARGVVTVLVAGAVLSTVIWLLSAPSRRGPDSVDVGPDGEESAPSAALFDTTAPSPGHEETAGAAAPAWSVELWRTGDREALGDGDRVRVGDALHLRVDHRGDEPLWLYLVNEDSNGSAFTLFPLPGSSLRNPLPPGELRLPGAIDGREQDWVVTSRGGPESFLLVTSRGPLPELERALGRMRVAGSESGQSLPAPGDRVRGVGGLETSVSGARPQTLLALQELALESVETASEARIVTLRGEAPRQ